MTYLRHLFFLLVVFLYAMPACAETMMPPGPSPEAGFAGVWRVVAAEAAPWKAPQPLSKAEAPLLEYAVDFAPGTVRGPAPLACAAATYSSGVSDQEHIFEGKLAKDTGSALSKQLNLAGGTPTVYRVYCGGKARDFYIDKDADLVMAENGVIYTLERPTGMDPQQYTAGYSGPSFDCMKAKTTGEKLVCRDGKLSKADTALAEAYAKLKQSLSSGSFATFQSAQRAWNGYVMKTCGATGPMPETAGDRSPIIECLSAEYEGRVGLLTDLQAKKSGPLTLEPRIRFRQVDKKHVEESDIYPFISGGPEAAGFNAFISKTLDLTKWRADRDELLPADGDGGGQHFYLHRSYMVSRFDSRLASLQVTTDDDTDANQPSRSQTALTWDLEKKRAVTLTDVFAAGKDWKPFVAEFCKKELQKKTDSPGSDGISDAEIAETVANNANWLWGSDKAIVAFMPGTVDGLAAGEIDVDVPLETLKPYIKPGAL